MKPDNTPDNFIHREDGSSFTLINQVKPIEQGRAAWITTREEVVKYVELPLLQACLDLWDKNIRTLSTSANARDIVVGIANITLDYNSLSDANKEIAQGLGEIIEWYDTLAVSINYPIASQTLLSELSQRAIESAALFKKQKARWVPTYTLEELKQLAKIKPDNTAADNPDYWAEYGLYFDEGSGRYFKSKEHFEKSLEVVDE